MASTVLLLIMAVAIHGGSDWSFASDTISANSPISGDRTVVSRGGKFELGFFSPAGGGGSNYYVGIWYKKVVSQRTPVWVANRAAPVADPASSRLAVAADGNLVLTNEAGKLVWSSNVSSASGSTAAALAVILDTGNLVLRREISGEVLWQSVEHPTDTWLPGVRLGMNKITGEITGEVQALVSWKNAGDPAPGMFTLGIDPNGSSQYFTKWNRTVTFWSSGEWKDGVFAGVPEMISHDKYDFEFVSDANANYFTYSLQDPTVISRLVLDVSGQVRQIMWAPSADEWMIIWTEPHRLCDVYAVCGAFGVCNGRSEPYCSCPAGFRPSSAGDWELGDHSHGCRRNNPPRCDGGGVNSSSVHGDGNGGDAFLPAPGVSLPRNSSSSPASSARDCELACLRSCNCTAYSYDSRCSLWYGGLLNLEDTGGAIDDLLYLRVSDMDVPSSKGRNRTVAFASTAAVASILALSIIVFVAVRMYRKR
ncbi:G-type lectin S-receptor-like serine/threonine-protein kinase At2g19130 [Panicum virgatum]|uniref:G-type lectin S-receptor-like serine/threonine-protein kinase At2g19130 n=1 Tax=Panicum virgatum TaxID=38727 RepID=UPI0019D55942|nr:G-type lectin S-receptor-like serine/threonine-protein kinase At2g19130 [Panicum virgatum]